MNPLSPADLQSAIDRGDELVTVTTAARTIGVGRTCVHQWIDRGTLPCLVDDSGRRWVLRDQASEVEHTARTTRRTRRRVNG